MASSTVLLPIRNFFFMKAACTVLICLSLNWSFINRNISDVLPIDFVHLFLIHRKNYCNFIFNLPTHPSPNRTTLN